MAFTDPGIQDFKNYFIRDFAYDSGNGDLSLVQDADIQNALIDAQLNMNQGLWGDQAHYFNAELNLAAHYMVMSLRASTQGVGGNYPWLNNSKAVGNVNESFQIPQRILDNPEMAMLTKTYYGAKYLFMILPLLSGNVITVRGRTKA